MVIIIWGLLTNRVSKFLSPQKKRVEPIQWHAYMKVDRIE